MCRNRLRSAAKLTSTGGGATPRLRRRLLGGVAGLGIVNAAGVGLAACATKPAATPEQTVAFHGAHQAGITTDIQDRLAFAAFDITTTRREDLQKRLMTWTAAAAAMSVGAMVPGDSHTDHMPPADTGEAVGLPPAQLTVTVGFGPSLFDERFGLAPRRPAALAELPPLPGEILDPARSGGDIGIQACANDPQVAFHAVRTWLVCGAARWSPGGPNLASAAPPRRARHSRRPAT